MSGQTYFIIAGEPSGDRLGAFITQGLVGLDHKVIGWGGSHMRSAGAQVLQDIDELKVMGWTGVVKKLPLFGRLLKLVKQQIVKTRPHKIILVDYGSFNLRIAIWAKKQGYEVIYYSPPKIWASRSSRLKALSLCDQVIVLFSFEQEYYHSRGLNVHFFGHPLADDIMSYQKDTTFVERYGIDQKVLAILPGSRSEEIRYTLPIYLESTTDLEGYQILISKTTQSDKTIDEIVAGYTGLSDITLVSSRDYHHLLDIADLALVTSGTASWEAAMHGTPQIVGYKTSWANYMIAKQLITVPHISLVNLIMGEGVIPELIQHELKPDVLRENIILLGDSATKSKINNAYNDIQSMSYNEQILNNTMVAITSKVV